MYRWRLLSRCLFFFFSRPKGGSAEERKGVGEGRTVAFRPDVAYNLLHTLFYGLLAFSTMRWAHAHADVIARSRTGRHLDLHTFPSSHIGLIPRQGLFKCTFPLDSLIAWAREQMLTSKCLLNAFHQVSEWSTLALINLPQVPSAILQCFSLSDSDTTRSRDREGGLIIYPMNDTVWLTPWNF